MPLKKGQYQIGDFVFGDGTMFNVEDFDTLGGYDVNVQDFQGFLSDENRFGADNLKPMPVQLKINARVNYALPHVVSLTGSPMPTFDDPTVGEFINEWRADSVRTSWGALKPLYMCRDDGTLVRMYGRPGKIAVTRLPHNGQARTITAEFRRSDTLVHSDVEWFLNVQGDEIVTVVRSADLGMGDGNSYLRFLLVGPMTHPIIQLGSLTIELDHELNIGDVVEISSYPWERRVISADDGLSLASSLISPYLDKLIFPSDTSLQVSWTATNINTIVRQVDFSSFDTNDWYPTAYTNSGSGTMGITNGRMTWSPQTHNTNTAVKIYKQPTVTNYQLVGFTLHTPAEGSVLGVDCSNRIIGRANSDWSSYLYWDITFTHCWFGIHQNGNDYIVSQKFKIQDLMDKIKRILGDAFYNVFGAFGVPAEDWDYEVEFGTAAGELHSNLRVNGYSFTASMPSVLLPYLNVSLSETTNKLSGIGMTATPNGILTQYIPGQISNFHVRDNPPDDIASQVNASAVYMLWRDSWNTP